TVATVELATFRVHPGAPLMELLMALPFRPRPAMLMPPCGLTDHCCTAPPTLVLRKLVNSGCESITLAVFAERFPPTKITVLPVALENPVALPSILHSMHVAPRVASLVIRKPVPPGA